MGNDSEFDDFDLENFFTFDDYEDASGEEPDEPINNDEQGEDELEPDINNSPNINNENQNGESGIQNDDETQDDAIQNQRRSKKTDRQQRRQQKKEMKQQERKAKENERENRRAEKAERKTKKKTERKERAEARKDKVKNFGKKIISGLKSVLLAIIGAVGAAFGLVMHGTRYSENAELNRQDAAELEKAKKEYEELKKQEKQTPTPKQEQSNKPETKQPEQTADKEKKQNKPEEIETSDEQENNEDVPETEETSQPEQPADDGQKQDGTNQPQEKEGDVSGEEEAQKPVQDTGDGQGKDKNNQPEEIDKGGDEPKTEETSEPEQTADGEQNTELNKEKDDAGSKWKNGWLHLEIRDEIKQMTNDACSHIKKSRLSLQKEILNTAETKALFNDIKNSFGIKIQVSNDGRFISLQREGEKDFSRTVNTARLLRGDATELAAACRDIGFRSMCGTSSKDNPSRATSKETGSVIMALNITARLRDDNIKAGNYDDYENVRDIHNNVETMAYFKAEGYNVSVTKGIKDRNSNQCHVTMFGDENDKQNPSKSSKTFVDKGKADSNVPHDKADMFTANNYGEWSEIARKLGKIEKDAIQKQQEHIKKEQKDTDAQGNKTVLKNPSIFNGCKHQSGCLDSDIPKKLLNILDSMQRTEDCKYEFGKYEETIRNAYRLPDEIPLPIDTWDKLQLMKNNIKEIMTDHFNNVVSPSQNQAARNIIEACKVIDAKCEEKEEEQVKSDEIVKKYCEAYSNYDAACVDYVTTNTANDAVDNVAEETLKETAEKFEVASIALKEISKVMDEKQFETAWEKIHEEGDWDNEDIFDEFKVRAKADWIKAVEDYEKEQQSPEEEQHPSVYETDAMSL